MEQAPTQPKSENPEQSYVMNARSLWRRIQIRNTIIILAILLTAFTAVPIYNYLQDMPTTVSVTEIVSDIQKEIKKGDAKKRVTVIVKGDTVELEVKGKKPDKISPIESNTGFVEVLASEDISISSINYKPEVPADIPWAGLLTLITLVLVIGALYYLARSMQSSGNRLMTFGQSKARLLMGRKTGVTFDDVAGMKEAKVEVSEIVEFLKEPKKFRDLGVRIPKGVILVGPPGSGKTLLARAIAGEAGVPFFHTSGAEFEEMLVGAGASRVRDLFEKAKSVAPALIFIDEIDAVARKRGTVLQSGNTEQTLNQILVEMDGFEPNQNVIIIAATNRPDVLDPAILRPGRFDRRVTLDYPDLDERKEIIKIHSRNKPLSSDFNLDVLAKRMVGASGAEIENTLNESGIIAARSGRKEISMHDLEEANLKVTMGPEKRRSFDSETIRGTAYHEAGHALAAKFTKGSNLVHKVSIIPRGGSLGQTMFLPDEYKQQKRSDLYKRLVHLVGGYIAEKVVYGENTSGVADDINKATELARAMVTELGMSDKIGFVRVRDEEDAASFGYRYGEEHEISQKTAEMIDDEVKDLIDSACKDAEKILKTNRDILEALVDALVEQEVLLGEEVDELIRKNGKEPLSLSESFLAEKSKQPAKKEKKA